MDKVFKTGKITLEYLIKVTEPLELVGMDLIGKVCQYYYQYQWHIIHKVLKVCILCLHFCLFVFVLYTYMVAFRCDSLCIKLCERIGGGRGAGWKLTQGAEVRGRFDITLFFFTKKTNKPESSAQKTTHKITKVIRIYQAGNKCKIHNTCLQETEKW